MKALNINVAVTGLQATDNPAPGVPVARSLRISDEFRGKITGLAYDALDTGIYDSQLFDELYLLPYVAEGENALLERLLYINKKNRIDVVIPTLDSELLNFIRISKDLMDRGISTLLPDENQFLMRAKGKLYTFALKEGFPVPETEVVTTPSKIPEIVKKIGFPLVVKGTFYEAYISYSLEEVYVNYNRIKTKWGLPVIIQEYLTGEEYDVAAVGDRDGKLVGAVAMRKLRLTEKGKAWAGVTVYNPELLDFTKKVVESLNWKGPLEIEFLKDTSRNRVYLFEINPRFPAWIYLSAEAGANLPLLVSKIAVGEKPKPIFDYKPGLIFVRHAVDLVCPLEYLESLTTKGELVYRKSEVRDETGTL